MSRRDALEGLVSELESFEIDLGQYWKDLEPQAAYDSVLSGTLDALAHYCQALGWSDLAQPVFQLLPVRGAAPEALSRIQGFILPEIRHRLDHKDIDGDASPNDTFWSLLHPKVTALAKPRFEAGFFGDAVESAFKEVNDTVKKIYREAEGRELDGARLMTTALSPSNPTIKLSPLESQSDINKQQGYMQIFAGSMTGIRNPKAHGNVESDARRTLHLLALASLLMHQIDERV